jgi:hypothetical protein
MIIVVNGHAIYTSLPQHVVVGGNNRHQTYFTSLEEQVTADNPVRLMDAFVEKLELEKLCLPIPFINLRAARLMHPRYF